MGLTCGAGEGNRTLVVSLEGFCSTIELHPLKFSPKPSLRPNPFIALEDRPQPPDPGLTARRPVLKIFISELDRAEMTVREIVAAGGKFSHGLRQSAPAIENAPAAYFA